MNEDKIELQLLTFQIIVISLILISIYTLISWIRSCLSNDSQEKHGVTAHENGQAHHNGNIISQNVGKWSLSLETPNYFPESQPPLNTLPDETIFIFNKYNVDTIRGL